MARKPTGTVGWRLGRWYARITVYTEIGEAKRLWIDLERPDLPNDDAGKETAKRLARRYAKHANAGESSFVGKGNAHDKAKVTIGELEEKWLALLDGDRDMKPSTRYGHKSIWKHWIKPVLGAQPVLMSKPALRAFLRGAREEHADQTVRNYANTLTRFYTDAKAEGWALIESNPMRDDEVRAMIPAMSAPDPEAILVFTKEQIEKLLALPSLPADRFGKYLVALTTGGPRDGETHGFQWGDLHLDDAVPFAAYTRQAVLARGKGTTVEPGPLKTRWSRRRAPIHPQALAWLRWWKETGWAAHVGREPTEHDYVFPDASGSIQRPRSPEILRDDLEAAGLPKAFRLPDGSQVPFDIHTTRHTFVSLLSALDVPGEVVDRLIGHAAGTTRGRHYQAPDISGDARQVAKLVLRLPERPGVAPGQSSHQSSHPGEVPTVLETPFRGETSGESGSRLRDLNSRPTVYESENNSSAESVQAELSQPNTAAESMRLAVIATEEKDSNRPPKTPGDSRWDTTGTNRQDTTDSVILRAIDAASEAVRRGDAGAMNGLVFALGELQAVRLAAAGVESLDERRRRGR